MSILFSSCIISRIQEAMIKEEEKVLMDTPTMSLFEISNTIASYLMHHKRYDIRMIID